MGGDGSMHQLITPAVWTGVSALYRRLVVVSLSR